MADARKKLAKDNSFWVVGSKANALRKVPTADVDEQELLPGISNEVTMGNIASKLGWNTCNVLQRVSRGWRQAIHNRNVYDARVLSKSTEAFLVVLSHENLAFHRKIVLTLYSCRDNNSLRLPPIRPSNLRWVNNHWVEFICSEGRVYVWIRETKTELVQLYVLDLAGDKKWTERKPVRKSVKYPDWMHGLGVIDGKIYRFRGSNYCGVSNPDYGYQGMPLSVREDVQSLPHTEIYNPLHDTWSLITPAPRVSVASATREDLEDHLTLFWHWEQEKQAADPSGTFLINGRYEGYFSEWKQKQLRECSKTSTADDDSCNGIATQVYYCHTHHLSDTRVVNEEVFFFGGKLVKYEKVVFERELQLELQQFDAQTNEWEHWKFLTKSFQSRDEPYVTIIHEFDKFVTANNSLWAIVRVNCMKTGSLVVNYFLVRSPQLVGDDDRSVLWIDTGFQVGSSRFAQQRNALRLIYL